VAVAAVEEPAALVALDRQTGLELWRRPLDARAAAGPVIHDTTIYVATEAGFEARRLVDGAVVWRYTADGAATGPAFGRDWVAFVTASSRLVCLDLASGEPRGTPREADPAVPPCRLRDGLLYLARTGLMLCRPGGTERPRRWMAVSWLGSVTAPAIVAGSRVYFATDRKGFICAGAWRRS
jgi:outer membrane protein assembly factor BamB